MKYSRIFKDREEDREMSDRGSGAAPTKRTTVVEKKHLTHVTEADAIDWEIHRTLPRKQKGPLVRGVILEAQPTKKKPSSVR